jgi:hypothetical protein
MIDAFGVVASVADQGEFERCAAGLVTRSLKAMLIPLVMPSVVRTGARPAVLVGVSRR